MAATLRERVTPQGLGLSAAEWALATVALCVAGLALARAVPDPDLSQTRACRKLAVPELAGPTSEEPTSRMTIRRRWTTETSSVGTPFPGVTASFTMLDAFISAGTLKPEAEKRLASGARGATDSFSGIRPADVAGFLLGQFIGTAAATLLLRWLFPVSAGCPLPKLDLPRDVDLT
jgi:hypothetical protein